METHEIAAFLRGLALDSAGKGAGVVVVSRDIGDSTSLAFPKTSAEGPTILEFESGWDEAKTREAIRGAMSTRFSRGSKQAGATLAIARTGGEGGKLFAIAPNLEIARAILEGGSRPASDTSAPRVADSAGSALDRAGVVDGRIALVTGGAQGFGEEITRGLVASGAIVWIADPVNTPSIGETSA